MACKPKALILEHSFVRRFQLFLDQGVDHRTVPGLNLSSVDIHFVRIGGRTVSKIFAYDLEYMRALQPEIGSNDLCEVGVTLASAPKQLGLM